MKAKNIIALLGLSFVMGAGVFAGVAKVGAKEANAAPVSTVYCKVTQGWWKADGAAVGAYFWNSEDKNQNNGWPGARMEAVGGQEDLWTYTVPNGYDKVIFTRVNGSGGIIDWGAKTADLDIPSKKNCFTITSESAVWGDPGVTGDWSVYPVVSPEYHLLGSFNSWNDAGDDYLFVVDGSDSNHFTLSDVVLTAGAEFKVADTKNDDWYDNGSGNITVAEAGTYDFDFYVVSDNPTHVVFTKQVVAPDYYVSFDDRTKVHLDLADEGKPEGVEHQYSATITNAYRGKEIKFYNHEEQITSNIGVDLDEYSQPASGNNIVENDGSFYCYYGVASMTIYFKVYSGGGVSLWATGYDENEYVIPGFYNLSQHLVIDNDFVPEGDYIKQYKTSVKLNLTVKAPAAEKYYITDQSVSQTLNIETAGQNNAVEDGIGYFNVHNDCSEIVYLKLKKDMSLWLYIGGYRDAHVVTIAGNTITLDQYKSETNEYYVTGVSLTAGDQVTAYTINGEAVAGYAAAAVANNNLNKAMKVVATTASADIYYKVSEKTIWISGIPDSGYVVYKNSSTIVPMVATDEYDGFTQYKTESTSFAVGDTIQIMNCGNYDSTNGGPTIWSLTTINVGGNGDKFEVVDGVIKCKTACSCSVYLKLKFEADEIYFGAVAQYIEDAIEFANGFKSAMSTACSAEKETKQSTVEAAWAGQATAFAGLDVAAKNELKLGGYSSVAEVVEFGARYVAIKAQHSSWTLTDFLDWGLSAINPNSVVDTQASVDNAALITIVTVISITSISAIAVLLAIKKRKHI